MNVAELIERTENEINRLNSIHESYGSTWDTLALWAAYRDGVEILQYCVQYCGSDRETAAERLEERRENANPVPATAYGVMLLGLGEY